MLRVDGLKASFASCVMPFDAPSRAYFMGRDIAIFGSRAYAGMKNLTSQQLTKVGYYEVKLQNLGTFISDVLRGLVVQSRVNKFKIFEGNFGKRAVFYTFFLLSVFNHLELVQKRYGGKIECLNTISRISRRLVNPLIQLIFGASIMRAQIRSNVETAVETALVSVFGICMSTPLIENILSSDERIQIGSKFRDLHDSASLGLQVYTGDKYEQAQALFRLFSRVFPERYRKLFGSA